MAPWRRRWRLEVGSTMPSTHAVAGPLNQPHVQSHAKSKASEQPSGDASLAATLEACWNREACIETNLPCPAFDWLRPVADRCQTAGKLLIGCLDIRENERRMVSSLRSALRLQRSYVSNFQYRKKL